MNAPIDRPFGADAADLMQRSGSGPPAPELQRLDALIERAVQRLRGRYQLSLDELRGLYIGDEQVDAWIAEARGGPTVDGPAWRAIEQRVEQLDAATRIEAWDDDGRNAWRALRARLQLTRAEADALLVALAPELDPRYGPLLAYLNDDAAARWATPELVARLAGTDAAQRQDRRLAAAPGGRLFDLGLLEWQPATREAPTRAQRGLRVAPALANWLAGRPYADERLGVAPFCRPDEVPPLAVAAASERTIAWLAQALRDDARWPLVSLAAGDATEAIAVGREIFRRAGRSSLLVDLATAREASAASLQAARLANVLFGVGIIVVPSAEGLAAGTPLDELCVFANGLAVVDVGRSAEARRIAESVRRELLVLPVGELAFAERAGAWRTALDGLDTAIDADLLADRFAFGPARIAEAVALARRQAIVDGAAVDMRRLLDAARLAGARAGTSVTRHVQSAFEWRDLVLPPLVQERLDDVVRAVELRGRVLEQWGFGQSLGVQRGLKVMFAGESGTGKSMAAGLVAKTLALDLLRIELAGVVSKYIGETEKNLDRAFEAARAGNAILFIDEADALFGKRSEVKDAHDRYANVEIAYLLQKMEDHDGVVILATNLANNIDAAFSRRMHFVVEFPLPDTPRRERLWRGMFPVAAPLAADIDFGFLARQFTFAGGDIRNVVLDAAYAAARHDEPISMAHVLRAVARQYAKRGKVAGVAEFREYHVLLAASSVAGPNGLAST